MKRIKSSFFKLIISKMIGLQKNNLLWRKITKKRLNNECETKKRQTARLYENNYYFWGNYSFY